jgi:hypothetical protein
MSSTHLCSVSPVVPCVVCVPARLLPVPAVDGWLGTLLLRRSQLQQGQGRAQGWQGGRDTQKQSAAGKDKGAWGGFGCRVAQAHTRWSVQVRVQGMCWCVSEWTWELVQTAGSCCLHLLSAGAPCSQGPNGKQIQATTLLPHLGTTVPRCCFFTCTLHPLTSHTLTIHSHLKGVVGGAPICE